MVAAQTAMMSRPSIQHNRLDTAPVSPTTTELKLAESRTPPTTNIDEKRTEPQEEDANRVDKEDPTESMRVSSHEQDQDAGARETADPFGESRARGKQFQKSGQYKEALEHYRIALRCKNKTLASEPRDVQATFGDILYDIGSIHWYSEHGDPEQCMEAFDFCLEVRRKCFGSAHPAVAVVLFKLASIYSSAGDQESALELLLEALSIFLYAAPADRSALCNVWTAIGNIQQALGNMDEAKSAFEEASKFK